VRPFILQCHLLDGDLPHHPPLSPRQTPQGHPSPSLPPRPSLPVILHLVLLFLFLLLSLPPFEEAAHHAVDADSDLEQVKRSALREWSAFLGRTQGTCFDHLDADIESLRKELVDDPAAFPRAVWNLYLTDAPIISYAAVAVLAVSGSEAAVERTFSAQGLVHSDLRNRMGDATVEAEMFIKFNQRTLMRAESHKQTKAQQKTQGRGDAMGDCMVMGEDYEEDDELPSVASLFTRPVVVVEESAPAPPAPESGEEEKAGVVAVVVSHVPRAPASDDVSAFIEDVVQVMGVTPMFRWTESRMNQLFCLGQQWRPPMRDTDVALRNKVMAHVKAREAAKDVLTAEL
jgi:hypothetical protein